MNERRTGWLLVGLLLAQMLMVAWQASGAGTSYLEAGALRVLAPVARVVTGSVGGVEQIGENLRLRSALQVENEQLREENLQLHRQVQRLRELESQVQQLAEAVGYTPPTGGEYRVADVVYADHASWIRTLVLFAPKAHLEVNQAVLTSRGLVGRVVLVADPYAKVQLITDRAASVGALIQRTRRQGLVRGTGTGELELTYLPRQSDVRAGDRVVTSGIDGIFPRGIPIGTVASVETGSDLFHRIHLAPAVDFGTLDHAYILERPGVPEDILSTVPGPASPPTVPAPPPEAGP
ncbi:MAG: rod shape-determining protein MreC [Acidobacteria bacterium]|nr:rod shape-determining protein MreC [Acidobacteriota bacterium]